LAASAKEALLHIGENFGPFAPPVVLPVVLPVLPVFKPLLPLLPFLAFLLLADASLFGSSNKQPTLCKSPKDAGPAKAVFPRYYWNANASPPRCESFTYGGAGGNDNRFHTQAECEQKCKKPAEECFQSKKVGSGKAAMNKFYWDGSKCEQFAYGGTGGNENRFDSLAACQNKCKVGPPGPAEGLVKPVPQECKKPKAVGSGRAALKKFYWDGKKCDQFTYGGSGGNENRFDSLAACQQKCKV